MGSLFENMQAVPLNHYIWFCAIIFTIGVVGVLTRRNAIVIFMSVELMLNAVNLLLAAFSVHHNDPSGQVFVFFILTVAAAEAAVVLAILVVYFRNRGTIAVDDLNVLKG